MPRLWIGLLLTVALSGAAFGEEFNSDRRLLLSEGILRGSPRLMGISGAFVGIAEGAEGITRNPAAAANPDPHYEGDWSYDLGGTLHFLGTFPFLKLGDQDWDNDGKPDKAGGGPLDFIGAQILYSTLKVQYKKVALGIGFDLQNFIYQRLEPGEVSPSKAFNLSLLHVFGSLAAVFWEDQIVVGLGVESTHAGLFLLQDKGLKDSILYNGWGIQFGGLWRPVHQNYRVGFSFRPPTVATPGSDVSLRAPPDGAPQGTIGNLKPFGAVVAPARISLGGSYALGAGRDYNILGKEDWVELTGQKLPDGRDETSPAMMKWLFTAQLDIFWPVGDATGFSSFLEQRVDPSAPPVNALPALDRFPAFEPRIAVEKEVLPDRLRFRAGGYLEPPLVAWKFDETTLGPGRTRPHVTFGGEVRIYKKLTFGISFDLAYAYMNLSVALYTWK